MNRRLIKVFSRLFAAVLLVAVPLNGFCEGDSSYSNSIEYSFEYNLPIGYEGNSFNNAVFYNRYEDEVKLQWGAMYSDLKADVVFDGLYMPEMWKWDGQRVGIFALDHILFNQDVSFINDFMVNAVYEVEYPIDLTLHLEAGLCWALNDIYALETNGTLHRFIPEIRILLTYEPVEFLDIYLNLSNYDVFRFCLLDSPAATLGLSCNFTDQIYGGFEARARACDMFTDAHYTDKVTFAVNAGVRF